jgi:uroporphyrinogen decarboxylase
MGVERLSLALYDDPGWVEEMMEHLTYLFLSLLKRLAGKVQVDLCWWWEDMCYNRGPLISPGAFAQLMVPRYWRITTFLRRELGCEYNMLDCDGNIHQLVPLWLQGGVNIMFPLEALHTDTLQLSREFGAQVAFRGAFNKVALIEGPGAIDREFERLRPLLKTDGFIPHTDHRVPPDVSLDNYLYYRRRKCEFIREVG